MFDSIVKLAKLLSVDEIRDRIVQSKTMQGHRVLYNRDYGNQHYGICFCTDQDKKKKTDYSYIHIRILVTGEFNYEEMISAQTQSSDVLMIALGKEIEV